MGKCGKREPGHREDPHGPAHDFNLCFKPPFYGLTGELIDPTLGAQQKLKCEQKDDHEVLVPEPAPAARRVTESAEGLVSYSGTPKTLNEPRGVYPVRYRCLTNNQNGTHT